MLTCDELTVTTRMCDELTGDELTVWRVDLVTSWLVAAGIASSPDGCPGVHLSGAA